MQVVSELRKKHMKQQVTQALKNTRLKMRYEKNDWSPSFKKESSTGMSEWQEYWCTVESISKVNKKKYAFAEVTEGDIVLFLPVDTNLPFDKNKYEFDYMGNTYTTETKPQVYDVIQDTPLSYTIVGELDA